MEITDKPKYVACTPKNLEELFDNLGDQIKDYEDNGDGDDFTEGCIYGLKLAKVMVRHLYHNLKSNLQISD
jgi:hypothetical protein